MKPVFIYFKEIFLDDNDKFTLDFSDTEFIYEIYFLTKNDYYISSLNCNLIVKGNIKKKKKRLIKELSKKVECYLKRAQHIKTIYPK